MAEQQCTRKLKILIQGLISLHNTTLNLLALLLLVVGNDLLPERFMRIGEDERFNLIQVANKDQVGKLLHDGDGIGNSAIPEHIPDLVDL